jgi:MFS superfamily sulfate permease-like transporter
MTGTTSQLACIVTAVLWIGAMPYVGVLMGPTPKAVLSAVIVSAVLGGVFAPRDLLRYATEGRWDDAVVGWGTGLLTAVTSPTLGFAAGLVLYCVTIPFRRRTPSTTVKKPKWQ